MADLSVSRTINASADELWAMVADLPSMGKWSDENTGGSWKGGATGPALGAEFKGSNRSGWRRWSTTCTVRVCEPGRAFAFDVDSGPLPVARWGYTFEPTADGGCTVTETWDDRRSGWMAKVSGTMMGVKDRVAHNRASMEATLAALAAAAEA